MGKPWEDYKEKIHYLYIQQNLPLKQVQQILFEDHGFEACKRAFQNQIEAWGFRKNVRSHEMQLYVDQKRLRKSDSEIDLPEETKKIITPRKARRFEKRSEGSKDPRASEELDTRMVTPNGKVAISLDGYYQDPRYYSPPTTLQPMRAGQHGEPFIPASPHYGQSQIINLPGEDRPSYGYSGYPTTAPAVTSSDVYPAMFTSSPAPGPLYDLTGEYPSMGMPYEAEPVAISRHSSSRPMPISTQIRDLDSELFTACFNGDSKNMRLLLDKGADPNATTMEGDTPLLIVVKGLQGAISNPSSWSETYGLDHRAHSPAGHSQATIFRYHSCLTTLLTSGADPLRANFAQELPLQFAVERLTPYFDNFYETTEEARKTWASFLRQLNAAAAHKSPRNCFPY